MILSPQLTAGAQSPMQLVAPSENLSQSLQCSYSNSNPNRCNRYRTTINMSFNQNPCAFPRLSLNITPWSRSRDFKSQVSSFPVPQNNLKNSFSNNISRFPALALANSYYDDESHNKREDQEEEEEKEITSSILPYLTQFRFIFQKEQKVWGNLVTGIGLGVQLISAHVAITIELYMLFLTVIITSPVERWIFEGLSACSIISAFLAIERYAFLTQEHQKSINGPSKLSPRFEKQSLMTNFYDGVIWGFVGMCLAIIALRRSVYSLKISHEFGYMESFSFIQSILKSFTPGTLVVSFELWPLQVRGNFVTGLGLVTQLISSHVAATYFYYKLALTMICWTSPVERWIFEGLQACSIVSAFLAIERYAFVTQEHQKSNGPSKLSPRFEKQSLVTNFYDGVIWGFLGTCLAIIALRRSVYSLKIPHGFGYMERLSFIQSILKSFTPGSLVLSFELWALQASIVHLLSNMLGLAGSLRCYDQREQIRPQAVAKHASRWLWSRRFGLYYRFDTLLGPGIY